MNAIAPFKCLLACVTATTMRAMMTACSPSRTPSSDASSTAKRPASTVEVRRGRHHAVVLFLHRRAGGSCVLAYDSGERLVPLHD